MKWDLRIVSDDRTERSVDLAILAGNPLAPIEVPGWDWMIDDRLELIALDPTPELADGIRIVIPVTSGRSDLTRGAITAAVDDVRRILPARRPGPEPELTHMASQVIDAIIAIGEPACTLERVAERLGVGSRWLQRQIQPATFTTLRRYAAPFRRAMEATQ